MLGMFTDRRGTGNFIEAALPHIGQQPKPEAPYPTLKESWGFLGWYILVVSLGTAGLARLLTLALPHEHQDSIPILGLVVLTDLLLIGLLYQLYRRRWPSLQLVGKVPGWLYMALPLLLIATVLLLSLLGFLSLPNWSQNAFERLARQPVQLLLLGGIVIPVLEEILFRGILLQGLLRNRRPWIAITQQALLFGLVHFNPSQSIGAFLIGLLMGWLCYRTGSLLPGIILHALNNLGALGMLIRGNAAARSDTFSPQLFGSTWAYVGLVAFAAVVLGLVMWRVSRLPLSAAWAKPSPGTSDDGAVEV